MLVKAMPNAIMNFCNSKKLKTAYSKVNFIIISWAIRQTISAYTVFPQLSSFPKLNDYMILFSLKQLLSYDV